MPYPVRYRCPRCGQIVSIERTGYLSDRSVTPYPLEGWRYASRDEDYEHPDVDGIRFRCGADDPTGEAGCERPFYLSFVRFTQGTPVDVPAESEFVEIRPGPNRPRWPRGP